MSTAEKLENNSTFDCTDCGAELKFIAGSTHLKCEYCGKTNEIKQEKVSIKEIDYFEFLKTNIQNEKTLTIKALNCVSCGATSSLDPNIKSDSCPYCATPFVMANAKDQNLIEPKNLLPFTLNKNEGMNSFKKWIKSLWFAPNSLKKAALNPVSFKGIYLPYWTFDSDTYSKYTGERGVDYYVTVGTGKDQKRERRTKWTPVSGSISKFFNDVLVPATKSVPSDRLHGLEPWDLNKLVNYDEKYLSGYQSECYALNLEEGFRGARSRIHSFLTTIASSKIGGDRQVVHTLDTTYSNVTFKHILLPVYVCAYRYKDKLYNFVINAQTGEVQGERPYSIVKIAALVLTIVGILVSIHVYDNYKYNN